MSHRRSVAERSDSGGLILRFDNVLLVRGSHGTWLLDLQARADGAHRRLQVPIGRHRVLDRFAAELLGAEHVQSPDAEDYSQK
jgi:hypothetical protein